MTAIAGAWTPDRGDATFGAGRMARRDARELVVALDADFDPELVIAAYERSGERCAAELDGDFAFALWDGRERRLLLGRDAVGGKALYYARVGDGFAFASDLCTLLARPDVPRTPDERAIVDYLGGFPEDERRTAFADIRRVPAATLLTLATRAIREHRYFRPDAERELCLGSDAEYAGALLAELRRAVRARLPAHGDCAVLLSGGLDSSAIACLTQEALAERGQRLITVSAVFDAASACDESEYQRAVVEHIGSDHIALPIESATAGMDLRQAVGLFCEPAPIGDHWMGWPLLEAAAQRGARVAFTGVDGDRVVSHGTGRVEELARRGAWSELWAETRARAGPLRALRRAAGLTAATRLPPSWVFGIDRLRGRALAPYASPLELIHPELIERHDVVARLEHDARRPLDTRESHLRALLRSDRTADLDLFHPLERQLGISTRHPFFDRGVIELCLSLPSEQKLCRGVSRFVLRQAMRGLLPETVRTRPDKASFERGFARWAERVVSHARDQNCFDVGNLASFVDVARLQKWLAVPIGAGPVDLIWRCVVGSAWLEGLASLGRAPEIKNLRLASNAGAISRNEAVRGTVDERADDATRDGR